ncbi:MAG TPA: ABC transporter permease [Nitrolancea sp.]|nr:ABC transporter permease [Nitrolancea sp.]
MKRGPELALTDTASALGDTGSVDSHRFVIEPPSGWAAIDVREIWRYSELLYFLTWRDVKVRYKQTVIGAAWAILQPFLTMVVFSIIFGRLINVSSGDVPYPVFSFTALLPWTFFATAISRAGTSLVLSANLISKVYFPRLIVPLAAVLAALVDFAIAFVILLGMMLVYGIVPGVALLALPFLILLAILTAFGVGFWLSALNVKYRDVAYAIPFLTQVWLFITPVVYSTDIVPQQWHWLYGLNPMAGVVEGFRWALLGQGQAPIQLIAISLISVTVLLVTGLVYFQRVEHEFADVV